MKPRQFLTSLLIVIVCFGLFTSTITAAPISSAAQQVVNELEQKGYDVTFVYFGNDRELTFGAEDCAVGAMLTVEHIKNFQFLPTHEDQYLSGNNSLAKAYPHAEAFLVALMEDLDKNGFPDGAGDGKAAEGIYQISGGVFGGRTQTPFRDAYWINCGDYVNGSTPSPTPTATPIQEPQPKNESDIAISCQSTTSCTNFKVTITGRLYANCEPVTEAQILLSYSVNAVNSWIDLATTVTNSNGEFLEVWMPQASGYYMLKAIYLGDVYHSEVNKTVNFVVMPYHEQNVFSVTSNSTVNALSFDPTSQTVSFSVNGTSNTIGYVSINLPKTMVSDLSSLTVCLDGEPLQYTAVQAPDAVLVTFTYHHSIHEVTVQMNTNDSTDYTVTQWIIILAIIIAVLASVAVLVRVKRNRKRQF